MRCEHVLGKQFRATYGCYGPAFSTWHWKLVVEVKDGSMSELLASEQTLIVGQNVVELLEASAIGLELSDKSRVIARAFLSSDRLRPSGCRSQGQDYRERSHI